MAKKSNQGLPRQTDSETQSDSISLSQSNQPLSKNLASEQSPTLRHMKKQKIVAKASIKNLKREVMAKKGLKDSGSQQVLPKKSSNLLGSPSRNTLLLSELKRMNSDDHKTKNDSTANQDKKGSLNFGFPELGSESETPLANTASV